MFHESKSKKNISIEEKRDILAKILQNKNKEEKHGLIAKTFQNKSNENKSYPLSLAQQRLWILDQLTSDHSIYNLPVVLHLHGSLDKAILRQSLSEIVSRHHILHTAFALIDGNPSQIIASTSHVSLLTIDLQSLPKLTRDQELQLLIARESYRSFHLLQGPLIRYILFRLSAEESILFVNLHQMLADLYSINVFVRELSTLYEAFSHNKISPLVAPPLQYVDFAVSQRQWLQSEEYQTCLHYWKEQLKGAPLRLTLPLDHTLSAIGPFSGTRQPFTLPKKTSAALKALSTQEGTTLFVILLAAFQVLLSRYSGQQDIIVGSSFPNRRDPGAENAIGCFINRLPLRTDLSGNPTFRALIERVQNTTLEAYTYQALPFEQLLEELKLEHDLRYSPIFQVMFTLKDAQSPFQLEKLVLNTASIGNESTPFDLDLSLQEEGDGLSGEIIYRDCLFRPDMIRRLIGHFTVLLEGIITNPNQRIEDLPLLTETEYQQLLEEWNATLVVYPHERCLHEHIEAQVEQTPDAIAILFEDEQISYHLLNQRANQLAHFLRQHGVGPEVCVGLCMDRSVEIMIGLLGILKAGGAYVPLDPSYPKERLAFMLQDAQVPVLLTQSHLQTALPSTPATVVLLDATLSLFAVQPDYPPLSQVQPSNLAYVIYTSGSTGQPKGVMNTHQGIGNRLLWMQDTYRLKDDDRILQKTSTSFDVSVWELFWPLQVGAQLVIARPGGQRDSRYLRKEIVEKQITTLHFVPSMLRVFLQEEGLENCRSIRRVICSGETLDTTVQELFFEQWEAELHNLYGPTEAAIDVTAWECQRGSQGMSVPIGKPISNMQMYILDKQGQPVPIGVPGELYIGGVGVARGYVGKPEVTAERFMPHPFSREVGARLYRTGDLVRYLPDGQIDFLGRLDQQVKVRGYRIELGEIEAALHAHAAVRECAVIAREDVPGDKRLVAYIVLKESEQCTTREFRQYLQKQFPNYMIPSAFVVLASLPRTPSGKIDRLPAPDSSVLETSGDRVAPRTSIESIIAQIWEQVLGLTQIGVYDSFFELGGHSLLITQVIVQIRSTLGVDISLSTFFESPFIADVAMYVEAQMQTVPASQIPLTKLSTRPKEIPLSFAQQRLWFIEQLVPDRNVYSLPVSLRLYGLLNPAAFQYCLDEIVRRHEALRTTFTAVRGHPVQTIAPSLSIPLSVVDIQSISERKRTSIAQQIVSEGQLQPFDLTAGPLLRVILIRLSQEDHILLLNQHHIVTDGWSVSIFVHELTVFYEAFTHKKPALLPLLPLQYADFAIWQQQLLQGKLLQKLLDYWKQQLRGTPTLLELPYDFPRPAVQTFHGMYIPFILPKSLSNELKALSKREGATLFMTLLAAFQILLSRYSGQQDIVVGTPIANRTRPGLEKLIGFFVNTLVLRTDMSGNPTFRELLKRVRQVALNAYDHQDLPFEKLVEELRPERDLSRNPLFQVMFILQNTPKSSLAIADLQVNPFPVDPQAEAFDLTLELEDTNDGISGLFKYNTELFRQETVERMVKHLQTLLTHIVLEPDTHLAALPLLSESEQKQLVIAWNATEVEYTQHMLLHQFFEDQVARTPEAIALVYADYYLTYQILDQRANQLAHHLQDLGVGPDSTVGVCVERSLEMIIGLLAILKAGGAYVPLDPSAPKERLAILLQDIQASVLLTQEHILAQLPKQKGIIVCLDRYGKEVFTEKKEKPICGSTDQHLAYVIYTSGSTGIPKGVGITHKNICNLLCWGREQMGWSTSDHVLQYLSYFFDWSVWEIFLPLACGASLHLLSTEIVLDANQTVNIINRNQITAWHATPTQFRFVAKASPTLSTLRWLLLGAEKFEPDLLNHCRHFLNANCRIFNAYGPTEVTITAVMLETKSENSSYKNAVSLPIGRPVANTQCYILDQQYQPVPIGVPGELYLAGNGVARGYINRLELTAEKFVANPFGIGTIMYKTGDYAKWLTNGFIEFLGRIDQQVKLRGYRIELGEIEAFLLQYPAVREGVVTVYEDVSHNKSLVAYIVAQPDITLSIPDLQKHLKEHLPSYMLPSWIVLLETLPLSPSGKLDRKALPPPQSFKSREFKDVVAPLSLIEQGVAKIWSEVLALELKQVSRYDNFFEIGGHSLLATQVLSRINELFNIQLPLRGIFEAPKLLEISQLIERTKEHEVTAQVSPIERVPRVARRINLTSLGGKKDIALQ